MALAHGLGRERLAVHASGGLAAAWAGLRRTGRRLALGRQRDLGAAALLALGMSLFLVNDALVKRLTESLPVGQVLFGRGFCVCLVLLVMLRLQGPWPQPRALMRPMLLLRGGLELVITTTILASLALLPLTTATVLALTAPIFLTSLAALLLAERVSMARWAAVSLGFLGAFVFIRPTGAGFTAVVLLPLLAAALVGVREVLTRRIAVTISTTAVILVSAATVTMGGLLTAPFGWQPLDPRLAGLLLLAGALNAGSYWLTVQATRLGELSFIAPFRYVQIPEAALIGFLVWGEIPFPHEVIGALLVVVAGILVLLPDRPARPAAAAPSAPVTLVEVGREAEGALEAFRRCWSLSPEGWAFYEAQLSTATAPLPAGYRPRLGGSGRPYRLGPLLPSTPLIHSSFSANWLPASATRQKV